MPPRTPQAAVTSMPILSHTQTAPARRAHARGSSEQPLLRNQVLDNGVDNLSIADPRRLNSALRMPPPPPRQQSDIVPLQTPQRTSFKPPATPQIPRSSSGTQRFIPQTPVSNHNIHTLPARQEQGHATHPPRFASSTSSQRLPTSTSSTNQSGVRSALPGTNSTARAPSVGPSVSGSHHASLSWQR